MTSLTLLTDTVVFDVAVLTMARNEPVTLKKEVARARHRVTKKVKLKVLAVTRFETKPVSDFTADRQTNEPPAVNQNTGK